ncbi:hypothetical protein [Spirillospora albida]|uniref:hypothetical protein n=1 Tax=Spirillospora albida TaxID=58123 RepID=UPI0004BFE557|nr:hypothetical protein [Spirillospora albida]
MTRVRWWGTGIVALVLLLVGGGVPALDRALGGEHLPLAPGTALAAGAARDGMRPVTLRVPAAGWTLNVARSSLGSGIELVRGEVVFDLSVVVPLRSADARSLWRGLERIESMHGQARLPAEPSEIRTATGMTGLTGRFAAPDRVGIACVLATRWLGAAVTASGPPAAYRRLASEVEAMVRTIRIAEP